jgi:sulfate permease, SulP family
VAAVIVTIMLIPQSLAYALLAGLPPRGLYASILPIMLYAIFGTSRALAVGPVAVVSLMTAAAVGNSPAGHAGIRAAAMTLAFLSGLMLVVMGLFRLGFLANFLASGDRGLHHRLGHPDRGQPAQAHPRHRGAGHTLIEMLWSISAHLRDNLITL